MASHKEYEIDTIFGDNAKLGQYMVTWKGYASEGNSMYVAHYN